MSIKEEFIEAIKKYDKMFDIDLSALLELNLPEDAIKEDLGRIEQCLKDGIPDLTLCPQID